MNVAIPNPGEVGGTHEAVRLRAHRPVDVGIVDCLEPLDMNPNWLAVAIGLAPHQTHDDLEIQKDHLGPSIDEIRPSRRRPAGPLAS